MTTEKRPVQPEDLYLTRQVEDPRFSPDGVWIAFVRVDLDKAANGYKRTLWLASTEGERLLQITRGGKESAPRWSPDGRWLAFLADRGNKPQIHLLPVTAPGGEPFAITEQTNGVSAFAWSPDGARIAFLSAMNAEERAYEAAHEGAAPKASTPDEEAKRVDPRVIRQIPYRTGTAYVSDRFAQVYVMGMDADGGVTERPRRLTDADANISELAWSADGTTVYVARPDDPAADEPGRRGAVFAINVADGQHAQIIDAAHVAGGPLPSPDGRWLAYTRTPHDGLSLRISRLAVLPAGLMDGAQARDLTLAADLQPSAYRWLGNDRLVFSAYTRGAGAIYAVEVATGEVTPLVAGAMKAEAFDVRADGAVAYVASRADSLQELYVQHPGQPAPRPLTRFNAPLFEVVRAGEMHHLPFTSPSGLALDGWYLLPADYQQGRQYPLILDIHGGPHVMWGPHDETLWLQWQSFAAQGYVVFFCNPRGSGGYGEAFQQAIYRGWAEYAYADIMAGLDALLARGFVDPARLGVTGGSYGGYMTTWIVAHTDRFAAAVTQRGVYNLLSFFGTTDIPSFVLNEFGTIPLDDPAYLWAQSPLAHAHRIRTPLLIMHSENDFRVPISEAEQLYGYVRRAGLGAHTEFVRYPREGHELSRAGEPEHRIDRLRRMLAWFDRYLKGEGGPTA
jgi:dipeptidyl aminopeptidase/acylaminoacyl peptidase